MAPTETSHVSDIDQERYRALVDSAIDWPWEVDADCRYTFCGPQVRTILGYEPAELIGRTPFDLMPREEADRLRPLVAKLFATGGDLVAMENVNRHKDGRLVVLERSGKPFRDETGNLAGYRGIDRDITERKRAEEALRQSETRYRTLFESTQDAVLMMRGDTFMDCNSSAVRLFGCPKEDIVGHTPFRFSPTRQPDGQDSVTVGTQKVEAALAGNPQRFEWRNRRLDGGEFDVEVSLDGFESGGQRMLLAIARDITDRKQAEEALRASNRFLEEAQRVARLGWYTYDVGSGLWRSSSLLDGIFGIADAAFQKDVPGWLSIVHPDDRQTMSNYFQQHVLTGRNPFDRQYRIIRLNDRQERWVHGRGELVLDGSGSPVKMIGVIQDITDRKQAEEALRASELKYRALVETTDTGFVVLDEQGRVLDANPQYLRLTGRPVMADILGQSVWEWTAAYDRERNAREVANCLAYGSVRDLVIDYVDNQGRVIPIEVNATVLPTDQGPRIMSLCRDITERRRAQEAIHRSEEHYRLLAEYAQDAIWTIDLSGRLTYSSPAVRHILGYEPEEVLGKPFDQLLTEESTALVRRELSAAMAQVQAGKRLEGRRIEVEHVRKDGSTVWVEVNTCGMYDSAGGFIGIQGVTRDISDRKRAENALNALVQGTASVGQAFFRSLVKHMAQAAGTRYAFVAEIRPERPSHPKTLAVWDGQGFADNFEYPLEGSPCENAIARGLNYQPAGARQAYPNDQILKDFQIESYMGTPLRDSGGGVIGILGVMGDTPMTREEPARSLLSVFSARAASELERLRAEQQLKSLNATLEERVAERTALAERRASLLRALASQLTQAEHRERRRIAFILHEHIQQLLAAALMNLTGLHGRVDKEHAQETLGRVEKLLGESIKAARSLTVEICPPVLYELGLGAALSNLRQQMLEKYSLQVEVQVEEAAEPAGEDMRIMLYEAARELLFNVVRHAKATSARVEVSAVDDKWLRLLVSDDGVGFDTSSPPPSKDRTGFGIFSIRERVEAVGGCLGIESAPGKGTRVNLTVPRGERQS